MGHPEAVHLLQRHIEALEREAEGEFALPPDHDTEFDSFDEHRHEYDNLGYGAPMAVAAADETNKVQNITTFNITTTHRPRYRDIARFCGGCLFGKFPYWS